MWKQQHPAGLSSEESESPVSSSSSDNDEEGEDDGEEEDNEEEEEEDNGGSDATTCTGSEMALARSEQKERSKWDKHFFIRIMMRRMWREMRWRIIVHQKKGFKLEKIYFFRLNIIGG